MEIYLSLGLPEEGINFLHQAYLKLKNYIIGIDKNIEINEMIKPIEEFLYYLNNLFGDSFSKGTIAWCRKIVFKLYQIYNNLLTSSRSFSINCFSECQKNILDMLNILMPTAYNNDIELFLNSISILLNSLEFLENDNYYYIEFLNFKKIYFELNNSLNVNQNYTVPILNQREYVHLHTNLSSLFITLNKKYLIKINEYTDQEIFDFL